MGFFNFEEQLAFYGQYHNNDWNRAVHIVFVPLIFWTSFVWLSALFPIMVLFDRYTFNVSFCVAFMYIFYYILLEPIAGCVCAPFLLVMTYSANVFVTRTPNAVLIAGVLQAISWTAQFVSHSVFEKRSPALLDNAFQSFLMAPLFVFMELLFALGYRPALYKRTRDKTKIAIATWKMGKDRKSE